LPQHEKKDHKKGGVIIMPDGFDWRSFGESMNKLFGAGGTSPPATGNSDKTPASPTGASSPAAVAQGPEIPLQKKVV
jgi:hypothetical protein